MAYTQTSTGPGNYPVAPTVGEVRPRDLAERLNRVIYGLKVNCTGELTIGDESEPQPVTVTDPRCSDESVVVLMARNAAAANMVPLAYIEPEQGSFELSWLVGGTWSGAVLRWAIIG